MYTKGTPVGRQKAYQAAAPGPNPAVELGKGLGSGADVPKQAAMARYAPFRALSSDLGKHLREDPKDTVGEGARARSMLHK